MTEKTKVEVTLLLPQGNGCQACVERLQERVRSYRGIEVAHLDLSDHSPRLCVHYDPELISLDYLQALVTEEGAHVEARYRHETLPIEGMDCADCARTLESGVRRLDGLLWAAANFASGTLLLEYDVQRVERPAILARIRSLGYEVTEVTPAGEMTFRVGGMDCADCALHLEEALRRIPGVSKANVEFSLARLRLAAEGNSEVVGAVERVAKEMGYSLTAEGAQEAEVAERQPKAWKGWAWRHRRDLTTAASGVLLALAVAMQLLQLPERAVAGVYIAAIIVGGYYIARIGFAGLRNARSLDMNALMTIAAVGSIFVGEWAEGAVAMFLFSLGNTLESYTMDRARNAIRGLMDLSPRRATVIHGSQEAQVPVEELRVGDRILVRPGERIPMDGAVISGHSAVNQAPVTGESIPADKAPGSEVFAGSVNGQGALTVRITRLAAETTIARIIRMVEEAQAQKAPSQRFVERFARVYTPAVIAIAAGVAILPPLYGWLAGATALGALFSQWVYRALVMLVIACPCALVISTPVTIVSGIARAARAGVLIKGGAHLEALGELKVIAFDKTGTLTAGRPRVVDVRCLNHDPGMSWNQCPACKQMLAAAAAVERRSEHPLGLAVVQEALNQGLSLGLPVAEAVEAMSGRGVRGRVNDHTVTVGTHALVHESHPELADGPLCQAIHAAQAAGQTAMVVRDDCCGVLGYIAVADTLRADVPEVMKTLRQIGIERTVMLTGDNEATAVAIATAAGVDEVQAGLMPEQKLAAVEALLARHGAAAMVGDGVNDAPALARATVGIAMGVAGTDTALETADVALMADDLRKLPFAVRLSRRARSIIRQNVTLSLGIKAVFLALALGGLATMWMAVFADMGASLIVTLNGMRLLRQK